MKLRKFIETICAMWKLRNEPFVFVSTEGRFVILNGLLGLRFEIENPISSDDYLKGYYKGVESALFDCGFSSEYVFKNTEELKLVRGCSLLINKHMLEE